jgi:hypothetical protein
MSGKDTQVNVYKIQSESYKKIDQALSLFVFWVGGSMFL